MTKLFKMIGKNRTDDSNSTLAYFQQAFMMGEQKMDDIYCMGLLQSLMGNYSFLPFTISSLRPFCMVHILNDIIVNERKTIIEFGSGLSTILIGRLIRKNALNARLITVEHNKGWINVLAEMLQNEGASDVIDIVYAPLKETSLSKEGDLWYDENVLNDKTAGMKFDMVIIDGPPAWNKMHEKARYPALSYIYNKLNSRFCIYLDDANRSGETSILQLWQKEYGFEFSISGGTLAYFKAGESFSTEPI